MSQFSSLVVAEINFVKTLNTSQLKFIHSEFSRLGNLVFWTDFLTKAGYSHHAAHSRAIFQLQTDLKAKNDIEREKRELKNKLDRIIGIVTPRDYDRLQNREVSQIKPKFKLDKRKYNNHLLKEVRVNFPTLDDPFFTVTDNLDLETRSLIKVDGASSIPMKVQAQDFEQNDDHDSTADIDDIDS